MPVGFQSGLRLVDWILSGASVDLDFVNNRFFGSSGGSLSSYLTISRASTGNAKNSSGVWVPFAANTLRITDLGLLVEDARTNYLLQSETPATQTTASLATGDYTLWVEGSGSALASGGSATITGAASATAGSPDTFTVTVAGTVVVTVTGSLARFQLENGAFATSYIPTTGTTATRAADDARLFGSASTITAGTVASLIMQSNRGIAGIYATIIRTNVAASMLVFRTDNLIQTEAAVFLITSNAANRVSRDKYGISWDAISASLVLNAGTVATQGNPNTIFTAPFGFGSIYGTGSALNGYFERLTIWNTRLADATLRALTAL